MLTIDEYRELGLALHEARKDGNDAEVQRIEHQLASAPRVIRRIYLGETSRRRLIDRKEIRSEFLQELLARTAPEPSPSPFADEDVATTDRGQLLSSPEDGSVDPDAGRDGLVQTATIPARAAPAVQHGHWGQRPGRDQLARGDLPGVAPGDQLGNYRLFEPIDQGAMGTVWLAEHTLLGERVAIKVLDAKYSNQPEIVNRFFYEARVAAAITDPGIVQIIDFGHVDGRAYVVMERLEGESLDSRLSRLGRLGVPDALRIMRQVASSLGAAHQREIVHLDLTPENVFMVQDPTVVGGERAKILDFGMAKLICGSQVHTQLVIGTPAYMSPEQCRGGTRIDERADVYSLGCMLFALVTGQPPFGGDHAGEVLAMHLHKPPPLPSSRVSGLPPALDALIMRCLAKDPAHRYGSGAEVAAAVDRIVDRLLATSRVARLTPDARVEHAGAGMTTLSAARSVESLAPGHTTLGQADSSLAPGHTTLSQAGSSWARRSSRRLVTAASALIAAGIVAVVVPHVRGPEPQPTLPAADDVATKVKAAVGRVAAQVPQAQHAAEVVRAQAAELSALIAIPTLDDAALARAAALRTELETALARLEADVAKVEVGVLQAAGLAAASSSADERKLIDNARATAQAARSAATSARGEAVTVLASATELLASRTSDIALLVAAADSATATFDFTKAKSYLERASLLLRAAGSADANLDYAYAQLYDRMSSRTDDPVARRNLLLQAQAAYQRFATTHMRDRRTDNALARTRELVEELKAYAPRP